jgi:signal transduction histidine kinase
MKSRDPIALPDFRKQFPWLQPKEKAIETLTAFVLDTEHDLLAVITALQAHIDLLRDEQTLRDLPVDRFVFLNRGMDRLVADANALAAVSALARGKRSKSKQLLNKLMQEIAAETQEAFSANRVSFFYNIAEGTTLSGNADALKEMITKMVLTVLHACHKLETVSVVGITLKKRVSLSCEPGLEASDGTFKAWQLGELRLIPMNGDGLSMSAIDAMARLHHGQLSVVTLPDQRHGFKLTLKS